MLLLFQPTSHQKLTVTKWVQKWRDILYLERHHVNLVFADRPHAEKAETCAEISQNEPYLDVEIVVYPLLFEQDADSQERIICHELCHVLLMPLASLLWRVIVEDRFVSQSQARDANELCTDMITGVLSRIVEPTPPETPPAKGTRKNDRKKPRRSHRTSEQAGFTLGPPRKS